LNEVSAFDSTQIYDRLDMYMASKKQETYTEFW